jgi:hypothetical protein
MRLLLLASALCAPLPAAPAQDRDPLLASAAFYASFDKEAKGDHGRGQLTFDTRTNHATKKGEYEVTKGFSEQAFRIAKDKGVSGGALEAVDALPNSGRIFVPAKGNIGYKAGGWSGAVQVWCKFDPDTMLKTKFCDPIQITHKGANNGAVWFDFNDAKPRDLRHGAFPAIAEGKKGVGEDDPNGPMVRVPKIGWKDTDWHHVVLSWSNFDTGKPNAVSSLYIDGKLIGQVKDRELAMNWDIEKTGIYVAINYIGLLDELVVFNRDLTADEVVRLQKNPDLMRKLVK